jgi:aspartate/methionine/tyrosine aminotransferase
MFSRRLPRDVVPNAWAQRLAERRASGAALFDLTESNPTRVGLSGAEPEHLLALSNPAGTNYEPDARGLRVAREAIAAYLREDRGVAVDPDHLLLTASTSEAYAHLFRLLADPGDAFLVPSPSYPLFEPLASLEGVRLVPYRLSYDGRWHLEPGELDRALTGADRVRAVVVVQPNHPTGSCLDPAEIEELERLCLRHDLAIVSDEVFGDTTGPPGDASTLPSLLGRSRVLGFVLGGLSKTCGMPQMKLAWIACAGLDAARDRALANLEWIADAFLSVSTPVQLAAPRLIGARHEFQRRVRERLAANRAALSGLAARRPELEWLDSRAGWSAVLRLPRVNPEERWALALLDRDTVVHPGHFYDFAEDGYLVLSLIPEPAVFAVGLARIESLAASW